MAMSAEEITTLVKAALPDAVIERIDTAGDNDHYSITVTSASFSGKSRIEQHRMVTNALNGNVGGKLHALSITTRTGE